MNSLAHEVLDFSCKHCSADRVSSWLPRGWHVLSFKDPPSPSWSKVILSRCVLQVSSIAQAAVDMDADVGTQLN